MKKFSKKSGASEESSESYKEKMIEGDVSGPVRRNVGAPKAEKLGAKLPQSDKMVGKGGPGESPADIKRMANAKKSGSSFEKIPKDGAPGETSFPAPMAKGGGDMGQAIIAKHQASHQAPLAGNASAPVKLMKGNQHLDTGDGC